MLPSRIASLLLPQVPASASNYCLQLLEKYRFDFKVRKSRITKVGDFTPHRNKLPLITVNHDLHPYLFLITFIHEVAHLEVHLLHGNRVASHGNEWKRAFCSLMQPVTTTAVFPEALLAELQLHMANPMASTFSDSRLTAALRNYDSRQKNAVLLSQLPEGTVFGFHGRWFKKGKTRRTRVECNEVKSRRKYLVPADVPVENARS
jgi:hypothetical protein